MRIPLFHVNAFTEQPFTGNPAAVCPLDRWLDDDLLRKVAAENNLSATAFFVPSGDRYEMRWFTPICEIRLCGHATLASALVVLNLLEADLEAVDFETRWGGTLTVQKNRGLFSMDFPALFAKPDRSRQDALIQALGSSGLPSDVLEVNDTYLVVYDTQSAIQDIHPDYPLLEQFHPFAVAAAAPGESVDFVSRYFAPSYGVPEDSVTGSVHCALTPYWTERLGNSRLHARQLSERGGELWCEMAGNRVILQGSAVLTMQGELTI